MALVILLYALFASLFGLAKATLEYGEAFFLIGSRMAFAGLAMFLFQLARNQVFFKKMGQSRPLFLYFRPFNFNNTN